MAKKPASTRIEADLMKRLELVARIDRRTVSQMIEMCVERALPELEEEMQPDPKEKSVSFRKQEKKVAG